MTNSNIEQYDWVKEIGLMTQQIFRPIKTRFILGTFQREKNVKLRSTVTQIKFQPQLTERILNIVAKISFTLFDGNFRV